MMNQSNLFDRFYADGATYSAEHDQERLGTLQQRVLALMSDGQWRTLEQIRAFCGGSEAGISARLRDLRKDRHGNREVERRRVAGGLFEYRLEPKHGVE